MTTPRKSSDSQRPHLRCQTCSVWMWLASAARWRRLSSRLRKGPSTRTNLRTNRRTIRCTIWCQRWIEIEFRIDYF
jgi:hypothetical protein